MIPELPSEPFVKRCHVRVLRASPARSSTAWRLPCRQESASFSSTSFPCVSKERLQSTISQAETERDANTKVELDRRNETMNDVYRAPSPLGVPFFACLCRFLCSCFLRRSPWPAFADPSLFGALQLRSTTPELIPSKWDPKPASSTSLSMLTFAPWPNITKRRGRHRQEGRLDLLWQRITQKLQIQPYGVLGTVRRVFSLRNRWAWCHAKETTEWDAVAMESLSALGCGFLYGRPLKG